MFASVVKAFDDNFKGMEKVRSMKTVTIEWASGKEPLTISVQRVEAHDNGCFVLAQKDGSLLIIPQGSFNSIKVSRAERIETEAI